MPSRLAWFAGGADAGASGKGAYALCIKALAIASHSTYIDFSGAVPQPTPDVLKGTTP